MLASTAGRCEITACSGAVCGEQWVVDDAAHVVRLARLRPVRAEVLALERLELDSAGTNLQTTAQQIAQFNGWGAADALGYLSHIAKLQQERSRHEWRLDLSLLELRGVALPPFLKDLSFAS